MRDRWTYLLYRLECFLLGKRAVSYRIFHIKRRLGALFVKED
jgi:hypothetical protein